MRIAVAGIWHETHTFRPLPGGLEDCAAWQVAAGATTVKMPKDWTAMIF